MAAPCPGHHHDDQHRIKFENEPASGITESASEALTEAEKFGDVICARVRASIMIIEFNLVNL